MTYSTGSVILAGDYNTFATGNAAGTGDNNVANVNTVWGAGTGNYGYGQGTTLSPVSAVTNVVTATQWSTMLARITSAAAHQGTAITAITSPVVGDTISAYAALSANITAIYNARYNAASSGADITTNGTTSTTTAWLNTATCTQTITFGSQAQARYFFNGGGMIRVNWSRSGGSGNPRDLEWTDLLSKAGTLAFTQGGLTQSIAGTSYTGTTKIGGGGAASVLASGTGYYTQTAGAAATTVFTQYADTAPYTSSYITVTFALNAGSNVITVTTTLVDAGGYSPTDPTDGTLTQTMVVRPPETTNLTNTWGTPAMSAASWALT